MIEEVDGFDNIDRHRCSPIKKRVNDTDIKLLCLVDADAESVAVILGLSAIFSIEINHGTDLIEVFHRPCELVAVEDDIGRSCISTRFGVPNFANDRSLLSAGANNNIVLVDVGSRKLGDWDSIDSELNFSAVAVETRTLLELSFG